MAVIQSPLNGQLHMRSENLRRSLDRSVPDPDLEIRGGGGGRPLGPQFGLKIRGGPGAPPGPSPESAIAG